MVLGGIYNYFSPSISSNKKISIVIFIIVIAIIIDTSFVKTYDLIGKKESLGWRTIIFSLIVAFFVVGQYFVLGFDMQKITNNIVTPKGIHLNTIHKIVTLIQYALAAILVFALLQLLIESYYSTIILILVTSINYILAAAMLSLLAQRFISWFKPNKSFIVLLYGLSAATLAINAGLTFIVVYDALLRLRGLRKSIRKSVKEHSKFLDSIGSAQMDQKIQEIVLKMTKDYSNQLAEDTGVESSLSEEEMKQYMNSVLDEIIPTKKMGT